jgi:hypothetical protein
VSALQRSLTLLETGTVKPKMLVKGRIALDSVPTAGTFFPLELLVELHHASSNTPATQGGKRKRYYGCTRSYSGAIIDVC